MKTLNFRCERWDIEIVAKENIELEISITLIKWQSEIYRRYLLVILQMYLCFIWFIFISNPNNLSHRNKDLVLKTNIFLDNSFILISFFSLRCRQLFFFFSYKQTDFDRWRVYRGRVFISSWRPRTRAFDRQLFSFILFLILRPVKKNACIDLARPFGCLEERKENCTVIAFTWFTFFVWLVECLLLACSQSVYR